MFANDDIVLADVGTRARVDTSQLGISERSITLECDVVGIDSVLTAEDCCIRLVGCDNSGVVTVTEGEVMGGVDHIRDVTGTCAGAKEGEDWLCRHKISGCCAVLTADMEGTAEACECKICFAMATASAELWGPENGGGIVATGPVHALGLVEAGDEEPVPAEAMLIASAEPWCLENGSGS